MLLSKKSTSNEQEVFTIRSIDKKIDGFGTLMKSSKPDLYLGKTIKMTGYVKSEKVKSKFIELVHDKKFVFLLFYAFILSITNAFFNSLIRSSLPNLYNLFVLYFLYL